MLSRQPKLRNRLPNISAKDKVASVVHPFAEGTYQIIDSARWAVKIAWASHVSLVLGLGLVTLTQGLIPAAMALVARGMINAAVDAVQHQVESLAPLLLWISLGIGLTVAESVSRLSHRFLILRLTDELDLSLTSKILGHAARLDVAVFETPRFQDVIHRAQQNTANHFSQFLATILTFTSQVLQIVSLAAVLVAIEPLVIVVLTPLAFCQLLFQWNLSKQHYLEEHNRTTKHRWIHYFTSLLTVRLSVPEVKLLGLAPLLIERFRSFMTEFCMQNRRRYLRGFTEEVTFAVLTTAVVYGMFLRVLQRFLKGVLTVGDVAIFGTVGLRLRSALETAVASSNTTLRHALYISNLREFLNIQPQIESTLGVIPSSTRGVIEFQNVSFSYPGTEKSVLSNISFRIMPGETVALVGKNGAGKTTLVKLMARFYDPDAGGITYDGIDLRELSLAYLHRQIAFVFQNSAPYEATVSENIAYGDWSRLLNNRDQIEHIARYAGVNKLIERMPQGYDTLLGRRFGKYDLSGGQWQQLAVARAFARETQLLILDEPTSNLDAEVEYELFEHFRKLAQGKTTILISHRFSTVKMADRIIMLDKGQVVEVGTHRELVAKEGHYAALYEFQRRQIEMSPTR